jgi:DNA-binding NarL/FixJ family response regulator
MIKLLIADDHAILRHGLRQIIAESGDMVVAGEAQCAADVIRLLRGGTFDVVLLDISLPDRNGIDVLKQIRREYPGIAVLMLTMHSEDEFGVRALKAGAAGYLTKQSAATQLVVAIRQVAGRRKYISSALAEELARHVHDAERAPHAELSDREFQTLRLIAAGKKLSEIAAEFALSPKTVSVYRNRLLHKLHLKNNAELTHYAIRNRLVGWVGGGTAESQFLDSP